jgi:hypothetical protein
MWVMVMQSIRVSVGGPVLKYSSSKKVSLHFSIFCLTVVPKIFFSGAQLRLPLGTHNPSIMTILAWTTRHPNHHPCTFSPTQYWFQRRDASSLPLEDPDRGTDEAVWFDPSWITSLHLGFFPVQTYHT